MPEYPLFQMISLDKRHANAARFGRSDAALHAVFNPSSVASASASRS